MKRLLMLLLAAVLSLSLTACGGVSDGEKSQGSQRPAASGGSSPAASREPSPSASASPDETEETEVPNNGEWDEIVCSGDDYYLVQKTIDTYNEYKIMFGVVDSSGDWVRKLTDTGAFPEGVQHYLTQYDHMWDSSSYSYLGEGVFLASPGVAVISRTGRDKVGPSSNAYLKYYMQGHDCFLWDVENDLQKELFATEISTRQDGYILFFREDRYYQGDELNVMDVNGNITQLPGSFYSFSVYSDGLFFAQTENFPGFFDIEGNMVINLYGYDLIPSESGAVYFEDGKATIFFQNEGGSLFKGVIDKTGTLVEEPEKLDPDDVYWY